MKARVSIAVIVLLLLAGIYVEARAAGDCIWGGLTLGSHHFHSEKKHNERNLGPHTEVCLGRDDVRLVAGWDRNSQRTDSIYFGLGWFPLQYGIAKFGIAAIRISGYATATITEEKRPDGTRVRSGKIDDEPKNAAFFAAALEKDKWGGNILFFPKTQQNSAVVAIQVKYKFR